MPNMVLQAAALPVRDGRLCLITSRRRNRWVIPKGRIDPGHTPHQTAVVEAWEEAGLTGTLAESSLGTFTYRKDNRDHLVTVFALAVELEHETWPEIDQRQREWVTIDEALRRVEEAGLRAILRAATTLGGPLGLPLLTPRFIRP